MNAEAAKLLQFAEHKHATALKLYEIEIFDAAGREAYLTAFAAARAVIIEKSGKAPKTHSGTRTIFAALIREGLAFDTQLAKFLSDGFEIKSAADYADGAPVGRADAEDAIQTARKFIEAAQRALD